MCDDYMEMRVQSRYVKAKVAQMEAAKHKEATIFFVALSDVCSKRQLDHIRKCPLCQDEVTG